MSTSSARPRNRRGEGSKLRDEILLAATKLLEETGSTESVTLRAIAREIGVAAPSIYGHFPNREAIVDAVIDQAFDDFRSALVASGKGVSDPVVRLGRAGRAYMDFAHKHPERYGILFDRSSRVAIDVEGQDNSSRKASLSFLSDLLQECVDAGASESTDPHQDAVAIWAAMHGLAMLSANFYFDWASVEDTLDRITHGLGKIVAAGK